MWALGNIAGDSPQCRDLVLRARALPALIRQLGEPRKITMLRNATWTLSNFCRGKPSPPFELVQDALGILSILIFNQVCRGRAPAVFVGSLSRDALCILISLIVGLLVVAVVVRLRFVCSGGTASLVTHIFFPPIHRFGIVLSSFYVAALANPGLFCHMLFRRMTKC